MSAEETERFRSYLSAAHAATGQLRDELARVTADFNAYRHTAEETSRCYIAKHDALIAEQRAHAKTRAETARLRERIHKAVDIITRQAAGFEPVVTRLTYVYQALTSDPEPTT